MWIDNLERQLEDSLDHLRWRDWAGDLLLALSGLTSFIAILTAFAGSYIDDENAFHAVVMFGVFFVESLAGLLTIRNVWQRYLPNPHGVHFVRIVECAVGLPTSLLSSILVTAFYVKRWEASCELSRGRRNVQKCDCIVASAVLGFVVTTLFAIKGVISLRRLRSLG